MLTLTNQLFPIARKLLLPVVAMVCLLPTQAQPADLRGMQMGVLGDSYVRNHREPVENTWHYKFAQKHGMQYFNYGRNGNCIALDLKKWGTGMYRRYTEMKDSLDLVVVIAGHNDASQGRLDSIGIDTFRERLGTLCQGLKEKYPQAKIVFFTPWNCEDFEGSPRQQVVDAMLDVCGGYGLPVYDAARLSNIDASSDDFRRLYFQNGGRNDHAHLNNKGHDRFLPLAEQFLLQQFSPVHVARFKHNRAAAISYTFDDGLLDQYTELFPRLKRLGLKASFCVNGNTINRYERMLETGDTTDVLVVQKPRMTWAMLREMSDDGQEITSHGWAHTNVNKIDGEALRYEVQHNDTVIWQHTGHFPRTFFYPGNAKSPAKIAFCERDRVASRTQQVSIGSKRNAAWLRQWVATLMHDHAWGIGMTHGIVRGYDHFGHPQVLWDHLEHVSSLRDSIWIDTFHDIAAYVKERDAVTLDVQWQGRRLLVTPAMRLDECLFNMPLTMVVDGHATQVRQDRRRLSVTRQGDKTLFDFNPHGGPISIKLKKKP